MKYRSLLAGLCFTLLAQISFAQTATVSEESWRGVQTKRGTYNVGAPVQSKEECKKVAERDTLSRKASSKYTCNDVTVLLSIYSSAPVPVVCPRAPAPVVTTTACSSPQTGTITTTVTSTMGPSPACVVASSSVTTNNCVTPIPVPVPVPTGSAGPNADQPIIPVGARTYYFSPRGNDANTGTVDSPKQNLSSVNINTVPAGTFLLLERGSSVTISPFLDNRLATATSPITLTAYGTGAAPVIHGGFVIGGPYNNNVSDGGYTIRNLKIDGGGTTTECFFIHSTTRAITIENNEITGCGLGFNVQNMGDTGNQGVVVRNNNIHHNSEMGFLGEAFGLVLSGNIFANNNFSGSSFNHAIYISGHGTGGQIVNNTFINNSAVNGVCQGGNVTIHGQWDGFLLKGNVIKQDRSVGSCYGISIVPGYSSAEFFRNFIIEDNTVANVGGCAYCAGAAVNPIFRRNKVIMTNGNWITGFMAAVNVGTPGVGGDDVDSGMTVTDNLVCFYSATPAEAQTGVNLSGTPGSSQSNNRILVGPTATAIPECAIPN